MSYRRTFNRRIAAALADDRSRLARDRALGPLRQSSRAMAQRYPDLAGRLRRMKEAALADLERLVEQAVQKLQANGCKVFLAPDAAAARDYILRVIPPGPVVKSKTNVGKEIGLAEALAGRGTAVIETDLGDRINQLAGSHATHPLAPAIHIPVETVRDLFARESGRELSTDVEELVAVARQSLRAHLENACAGISGANAIAADTGTIVLMENEGNIRAVTSLPEVHVVVAGINKIVPTFEDAVMVVQAASIYGAGQDFGTYLSAISGPAAGPDAAGRPDAADYPDAAGRPDAADPIGAVLGGQGPREVHVVLLDNGRSRAVREGYGEAFYCLNCGSCQNFCPVYGVLGDGFGQKYIGGIGLVQTVFTQGAQGEDAALAGGLAACLTCGSCVGACPAQIDTPSMVRRLRRELALKRGLAWPQRLAGYFLAEQGRLAGRARAAARLAGPLQAPAQEPWGGVRLRAGAGLAGLDRQRLLPAPARVSFLSGVARGAAGKAALREDAPRETPVKKVALYVGCLVNVFYPEIGRAALAVLDRGRTAVLIPRGQQCCGLPLLAAGDWEGARKLARRNLDCFDLEGVDAVVNLCASCGETLLHTYPRLLADDPVYAGKARRLAGRVKDITVFLADDLGWPDSLPAAGGKGGAQMVAAAGGAGRGVLAAGAAKELVVTYHDPCHLRLGQGVSAQPRRLLAALPGAVYREMADADTCCGFGGLVSLEYDALTAAISREKAKKIAASGASVVATACPGCLLHLNDGLARAGVRVAVKHVVELLAGGVRPSTYELI